MSKLFACFMIAILIALPACGGGDDDEDGGDVGSVEDVETCEQLADLTIDEVQVMLDSLSELDPDELQEAMQSGETPDAMTDFESQMSESDSKADELNCDEEEFLQLLDDRTGELEASGLVAEQVLEQIQNGSFFQDLQ